MKGSNDSTKPLLQDDGRETPAAAKAGTTQHTSHAPTSSESAGKRKRVLIVGAGAAGMSCAHHLAQHPDRFDVTLIEAVNYCGGQAFSIPIDREKHGASWLNQGVQGGSFIFHHTMTMFSRMGYRADPVELQVCLICYFLRGGNTWRGVGGDGAGKGKR
jgi:hypothetical protein